MPGQQKSGGGAKKIGRNKVKCERYSRENRREKSKLKEFKEHNIPKDANDAEKSKLISAFMDMQSHRKKKLRK